MAARTYSAVGAGNASAGSSWNGGGVLNAGDTVTFDATSITNCNWDTSTSVAGITVAATYLGTITCSVAVVLTGNFSIAGGTWDNATFAFNANSGAGTLSCTGGTFKGGTTTTSTGAVTFNGTGTIIATSGTWNLAGSWTQSGATSTFTHSSGTINETGTGTITDTRSTFNKWTFNASATVTIAASTTIPLGATPTVVVPGGGLAVNGIMTYSGTMTMTGALATGSGSTVTGSSTPALIITGSLTINSGATGWTSVNITANGTTGTTYTDTGAKNSGTWTLNKTNGGVTVAASTTMALGASPTVTTGSGVFTINGTLTWSGLLTIASTSDSIVGSAGVLTGTSTPTISTSIGLNVNATATITNAIGTITLTGGVNTATITDTGDKLSGSTYVLNRTGNAAVIVAASTTMRLGATPTVSLANTGTLTVTGTLTYSGTLTMTGSITVSATTGTVTGTSTPALTINGSLNISATAAGWTSVNILANGSNGCTYTDTAGKNTGVWTVTQTGGGMTIAANTTADFGTNPTWSATGASIVVTGTIKWAGAMTANNTFTINGTATATSTPTLTCAVSLTIGSSATITNTIGTVTFNGTGTATFTDTGDKLSASSFVVGDGSNKSFTVAASTTLRLGASPSTATGTSTFTVTGTVLYSGTWTHNGLIATSASSTVTGSSSPALSISGSLTISATTTSWTSVNITYTGSALQTTHTDTGGKNTGIVTISKATAAANVVIAASSTVNLGATPSSTGNLTVTGTLQYTGTWSHNGNITVSATTGSVSGSSTPALVLVIGASLNISATAAGWTSVNVTVNGSSAGTYTDTAGKNTGIWTFATTGGYVIAASTTCNVGASPSLSINSGNNTLTVSGTLTWSGAMNINGALNVGATGVLTGTSTPTIIMQNSLTMNATATVTNAISSITFQSSANSPALTDTGDKLSATIYTINLTGRSFTIAASTNCRVGSSANIAMTVGTITVTGTLTYSGTLTVTGNMTVSAATGTVTGSSSPSLVLTGNLTINATAAGWTSVNILSNGTANCTYTDTAGKNTGTWTVTKTGTINFVLAASTTMSLGAAPSSTLGGTLTINGILQYSGRWTHDGSITTVSGSTVTGSSSPSLSLSRFLTIDSASTWTSVDITAVGAGTTLYTDTGTKNTGIWTITKTASVTVAASSTMNLGTAPSSDVGLAGATLDVFGTLSWTGYWTHNGNILIESGGSITGAVTGINSNRTFTFTSGSIIPAGIPVDFVGSIANSITAPGYTFGTCTIRKTGGPSITAGTTVPLGANPTVQVGTGTIVLSGTLTYTGVMNLAGNISIQSGGSIGGSPTGVILTDGTWQLLAGAIVPDWLDITYYRTDSVSHDFNVDDGRLYNSFRLYGPGTGLTTIKGASTFRTFQANEGGTARTLTFTSSKTQTADLWLLGGAQNQVLSMPASTPGVAYTLHSTSAEPIYADWINVSDSTVDQGPDWYAGPNSVLGSGNTNWLQAENEQLGGGAATAVAEPKKRKPVHHYPPRPKVVTFDPIKEAADEEEAISFMMQMLRMMNER